MVLLWVKFSKTTKLKYTCNKNLAHTTIITSTNTAQFFVIFLQNAGHAKEQQRNIEVGNANPAPLFFPVRNKKGEKGNL